MGKAADLHTESIDESQPQVNPFHVAQMNVIGGGSGSSEYLPIESGGVKKNLTHSKGKGGSIIVVN
jgi:hypothetical protein